MGVRPAVRLTGCRFGRKMNDPEKTRQMNDASNTYPVEKFRHTIDDVAKLYDLDPWMIRLWANRFETLTCISTSNGGMLFTPQAVEQIGEILRLTTKKMGIEDVRKYLESKFGNRY